MTHDDPFSEPEKTIIRPSPGGRRGGPPPIGPSVGPSEGAAPAAPQPVLNVDVSAGGLNPLIAAATPILALAVRLRGTLKPPGLEGLRERVASELRAFQQRIGSLGLAPEAARAGFYAVCATIDDVISNTPWGSDRWARQAMAVLFFKDAAAGERFFQFLDELRKDPGRFGDVLELMYLCLSLGFEGRLRVAGGTPELHRIREGLHNTLRQRRGTPERDLSPHWRGVEAPHRPLTSFLPGWVVAVAAAALATVIFAFFYFKLNAASDDLFGKFAALPPKGNVEFPLPSQPAPPPIPVVRDGTLARLKSFLAEEVRQGLVELAETPRTVTVRLLGQEMFDSGKADVNDKTLPLLARIGSALDAEPGSVLVVGHTDNVPIRSFRFPSNFHLSRARAEAVRDVLKRALKAPDRLTADGRADAEPLAPNDSPQHRALNRRIELALTKQEVAAQ
jgi:type VI secretion system protein ImpK